MSDYIRSSALKALDKNIIAAAREGDCASVVHMVNFLGVPVDFQEIPGLSATALMTAAQKGFLDILKFLLMNNADPNKQDREHKTALIIAVMNNQIACIRPLMEFGANPNLYSKNGWTALYIAANRGFTNIIKELVSAYGVSQNGTAPAFKLEIDMSIQNTVGGNVLMVACMQGHLEIVELLTKWGADVNARDNNNWTALMKAADKGHAAVVTHLIKHGADVTHTDNSKFTALHLAAKANMTKAVEVLLSSAVAFVIINAQDVTSRTALFYAAQNGHLETVKILMKHGADPTIADKAQRTASTVAKDPKVLEELKNIVEFPVSGEKHPDAVKDAVAPSLTEDLKQLNIKVSDNSQSETAIETSPVKTDIVLSLKRSREEEVEENTNLPQRKLQKQDADYIAAQWCGDKNAVQCLQEAAGQGDVFAKGYMAILYHFGCFAFRADRSLACEYATSVKDALEKADAICQPTANFLLGVFSYEAIGEAEALSRAFDLFTEAARAGHANALYMLGLYYEQSAESSENNQKALGYFQLAAERNHPQALFAVGYFYAKGRGVPMNLVEGFKWFEEAAQLGHACAATNVGTCFQFGNGVVVNEKEAVKYFRQGAERGDPYGAYNMAVCHEEGIGGTKLSVETAATFYQQAADLGHAKAQVEIAMHYLNGTAGLSPNDVKAATYFELAAEQGNVEGQYRLGVCFMHGRGVLKDIHAAVDYLQRAASQEQREHACARIDLAHCLVCSVGTEDAVRMAKSMLPDILLSLLRVPLLAGLSTLMVIVPRWKTVEVSGYVMHEASSDYRLHFLDDTTKKPVEDRHYDIAVSRQWLMDAAPVLKAGLLCLYMHGNSHLLANVDLAMNVLQELPRDIYKPSREVCCAGDSDAMLRHAYQVIYDKVEESSGNNSESMIES